MLRELVRRPWSLHVSKHHVKFIGVQLVGRERAGDVFAQVQDCLLVSLLLLVFGLVLVEIELNN